MTVTPSTTERQGPAVARVGGWLAGGACAVVSVMAVIAMAGAEREWGMLGPLYQMRFVVIAAALAWVAGMICFSIGWFVRGQVNGVARVAGILWATSVGLALLSLVLGLAQVGASDALSVLAAVVLLAAYIVTAVALGAMGARDGMWGFVGALISVALVLILAWLGGALLGIALVLFFGFSALGFIAGGAAMARTPLAG